MRISDWSSDVCSSDLFGFLVAIKCPSRSGGRLEACTACVCDRRRRDLGACVCCRDQRGGAGVRDAVAARYTGKFLDIVATDTQLRLAAVLVELRGAVLIHRVGDVVELVRSEEHTSELQSLMRISYAVFCLKQKT